MDDLMYMSALDGNQTLQAQNFSILNRANLQSSREQIHDEKYPRDIVSTLQNTPSNQLGRVRTGLPDSQVQQYNLRTYVEPNQYQVDPREKQGHVRDIHWLDNRTFVGSYNLVDPGRVTQYSENSPLSTVDTLNQIYPTDRRENKDVFDPKRQAYDMETRSFHPQDLDIFLQGYPVSSRNIDLPNSTLL